MTEETDATAMEADGTTHFVMMRLTAPSHVDALMAVLTFNRCHKGLLEQALTLLPSAQQSEWLERQGHVQNWWCRANMDSSQQTALVVTFYFRTAKLATEFAALK